MLDLTIIILTYNEEKHIERCLKNAFRLARTVIIVDSFSTDRTVDIAQSLGAHVVQHEFVNHSAQLDWALGNVAIDSEWVMRIDADEIISSELEDDIRNRLPLAASNINGFQVLRYVCFDDKLIRFGGFSHWVLRIWRKGKAQVEQRWMDEHMILQDGVALNLKGKFIDHNLNGITWWINKHNNYATREAIDLLSLKYNFSIGGSTSGKLTTHSRIKRWLKENFYAHLPLGVRSFMFFAYRMIFRLGILDGGRGFAFHFLQGFWYRYIVDFKIKEIERRMQNENVSCPEAIRREFGITLKI